MENCSSKPTSVGYLIPFCGADTAVNESLLDVASGSIIKRIVRSIPPITQEPCAYDVLTDDAVTKVVCFRVKDNGTPRELFCQMAKAFKLFRGFCGNLEVLLGNAADVYSRSSLLQKIFELPKLVFYSFDTYMSDKAAPAPTVSYRMTPEQEKCSTDAAKVAEIVAEGTILARELVNQPAAFMTPEQLANCAMAAGEQAGFVTEVLGRQQIEEIGMKAFLAVSAGAFHDPKFIIMRYNGAEEGAPLIALVGKGITFDSGGYSLKNKDGMVTMHTDMGGAAAVIGAMYVAAKRKLKLNLVGLVPACENLIGPHATLPGAVISSLLGRTIEVVSTDGEGRLILCDALTYAAQNEKADILIDIATLTGGAAMAVGKKTGVVITEDEALYEACAKASRVSCEKVWRLDMDEELRGDLKSFYADTKNSPGGKKLGGTIIAALFLKPFTLGKRWMHIDMAPVAWTTSDELPYAPKGATGYGVALLGELLGEMTEE